jgi:predicted DNA-binding transcriptional regulator AlpA
MENPSEIIRPFDRPEPIAARASNEGQRSLPRLRKPPRRVAEVEPLLTAEDVAKRLNVSTDWVWDHSSRKKPLLPVIRMGDGALRYRASGIEAFIDERERVSSMGRRAS